MRARCPCPAAGGRRRCRSHIYSGSPNCSSRVAAAATHRRGTRLPGVSPPPASPVFAPALATPTGSTACRQGRGVGCAGHRDCRRCFHPRRPPRAPTGPATAANRPLLRCSAASQPRRPAPRRLPWRQLCCSCSSSARGLQSVARVMLSRLPSGTKSGQSYAVPALAL